LKPKGSVFLITKLAVFPIDECDSFKGDNVQKKYLMMLLMAHSAYLDLKTTVESM
jgi:hypothetical protein